MTATAADSDNPFDNVPLPRVDMPPVLHDVAGGVRRVGVEVELAGISLHEICSRIAGAVGGDVHVESPYLATVEETSVGRVRVELDAALFRDLRVRGFIRDLDLDQLGTGLGDRVEELLADGAMIVVPFEVVFDPLEIPRLAELEAVRRALYHRVQGTGSSILNAFGLHLNPELPRPDAATALRYLRAFLLLFDDLRREHRVDFSRQVTPFIDLFPAKYARTVCDPGYAPSADTLIDDYIEYNPTRNRPLDMLPLFAWMDGKRVEAQLPGEKINPRPTLHYRLPNSQLDDPEWSFVLEWNRWVAVERLATDGELLEEALADAARGGKGLWDRLAGIFDP